MITAQAGLRKRQQIAGTSKMMFIWVAGASVIVGAALVAAIFLGEKLIFTEKVLEAKQQTASTLSDNLSKINGLKDQIRVLNTNSALQSVMTPEETDPIQVVLDALPSDANSTALGASLQQKFLNLPGLTVQQLSVTPVSGVDGDGGTGSSADSSSGSSATPTANNAIAFSFTVQAADANTVEALLKNIEKSIRTIDLTSLTLDYSSGSFTVTAEGQAYYQPSVTVKLKDETIKP